jgi:virginiamycin A acetyltransferase
MLEIFTPIQRRLLRLRLACLSLHRQDGIYIRRGSQLSAASITIGDGSRINGPCLVKGAEPFRMGRYCAVGWNARFITSNHSTTRLNLNLALQAQVSQVPGRREERGGIQIGHNVWIGDSAIVLPGVTIGNGAVVGAGSVVTRQVDPYSIVAGNPARVIRLRFERDIIDLLEESGLWDRSTSELRKLGRLFDLDDCSTLTREQLQAYLNKSPTAVSKAA